MSRRLLSTAALVVVSASSAVALAAPAAAETRTFAATRGDSESPTTDIVSYTVALSPESVAISYRFAAVNDQGLDSIVSLDTNGDGEDDHEVYDSGSISGESVPEDCEATVRRAGDTVSFAFPARCIGSPRSLRVQLYAAGDAGFDFEPGTDTWSPAVSSGAATAPVAPVTPTPPVTPVPVTPVQPPPASPAPVRTQLVADPRAISLGQSMAVGVEGAPGATVQLYASSRPSTTYRLVRTGLISGDGLRTWTITPPSNTRLYARVNGRNTATITVDVAHTSTIGVTNSAGTYRFTGVVRPGFAGLPVTLLRALPGGGATVVGRTTTGPSGTWRIDRRFSGSGTFGFSAVTGASPDNAAGRSRTYGVAVSRYLAPRPVVVRAR